MGRVTPGRNRAMRRVFGSALAGGVVWIGLGAATASLAADRRFQARPFRQRASGPAWANADVVRPVRARLRELGPVNLFDPHFEARIRAALESVPGVARVIEVRRIWPRRYGVRFTMHRPRAVVRHGRSLLPVSADAVVLPLEPYAGLTAGLWRIAGLEGVEPAAAGRRWRDPRLRDALAAIAQLAPYSERLLALGLETVDVSQAADPRRGVILRGRDDITVRWGRPRARVGENDVATKIAFLEIAAGHLEHVRGREIDVRYGTLYLRESATP